MEPIETTPNDILEVPEVRAAMWRLSVDEYHRLSESGHVEQKTELIRGVVIDKMTKSPRHSLLAQLLVDWLRNGLPPGWLIRQEQPLTLRDSEPEPDIAVVRGSAVDYCDAHPATAALAIEIAVTSNQIDQQKASLYAEAGVDEYWIVLAERNEVQVFTAPASGAYARTSLHGASDTLTVAPLGGIQLPLATIFPSEASGR
ncbi:MAG: Uma2 family endonuclease [Planctomycetota bacterium]